MRRLLLGVVVLISAVRHPLVVGGAGAQTSGPPPVIWYATGDSYSSGQGAQGNTGDCSQTEKAWGPRAARILEGAKEPAIRVAKLTFTACTGRVVSDQFVRNASGKGTQYEWATKQLGLAPRSADVVTMTYAGNDLLFAETVTNCVLGDGSWSSLLPITSNCLLAEQDYEKMIDSLGSVDRLVIDDGKAGGTGQAVRGDLQRFYEVMLDRLANPKGHLIILGYPPLFAPSSEWGLHEGTRCTGIKRGDANMLSRLAKRLDDRIRSEALAADAGRNRIHHVSVIESYEGRGSSHSLCGDGQDWLNRMTPFPPKDSFHPNLEGYEAEAQEVARVLDKDLDIRSWQPATTTTSTASIRSLTRDQLLSAPVPSLCEHPPGRLVGGKLPGIDEQNGFVSLGFVTSPQEADNLLLFGDVDGSPGEEAVVVVDCNQGGVAWPQVILVYGDGPTLRSTIELSNSVPDPNGRARVEAMRLESGAVAVQWLTSRDGDAGCCSSLDASARIRLEGNRAVITDVKTHDEEPAVTAFVNALERRDRAAALRLADADVVDEMLAASQALGSFGSWSCQGELGDLPLLEGSNRVCTIDVTGNPPAIVGWARVGFGKWRAVAWSMTE